jgi:hypothetical protein
MKNMVSDCKRKTKFRVVLAYLILKKWQEKQKNGGVKKQLEMQAERERERQTDRQIYRLKVRRAETKTRKEASREKEEQKG